MKRIENWLLLFKLLQCLVVQVQGQDGFCAEPGDVLIDSRVCIPANYTKTELPKPKNHVDVQFYVTDFPAVSDKELTITATMYLTLTWLEPRILINHPRNESHSRIALGTFAIEAFLWKPDIFINNLARYEEMRVIDSLSGLSIFIDKKIEYWVTAKLTVSCSMDFGSFPFDLQTCKFLMQSSNFQVDEMMFSSETVFKPSINRLQDYQITVDEAKDEDKFFIEKNRTYSQVGFIVHIQRRNWTYILKYYIPCFALTTICFMSFAIPADAIPGRVALLVTLVLVLSTFSGEIQVTTPRSEGLNALQIYALTCMLFALATMFEYAFILVTLRVNKMKRHSMTTAKKNSKGSSDTASSSGHGLWTGFEAPSNGSILPSVRDELQFAFRMDKHSSIILMLLFVSFHLVYAICFISGY